MSIIVPVKNDIIETDEARYIVLEYTNLKVKPAVYIDSGESVFFEEIRKINGIRVELTDSNCFNSLGLIKRKFHLPQPKDLIKFLDYKDQEQTITVDEVKLHKRDYEYLHFCGEDICVLINNIIDIDYADGDVDGHLKNFNRDAFMKYYKDYLKKTNT